MAFFSVGDVVTVRTDLVIAGEYYSDGYEHYDTFVDNMDHFKGARLTISRVFDDIGKYEVEEDGGDYFWTDAMFAEYFEGVRQTREMKPWNMSCQPTTNSLRFSSNNTYGRAGFERIRF